MLYTVIKNNAFKDDAMAWGKCSLKMLKIYTKFNTQYSPNFLEKIHIGKKIRRKYTKMLIPIPSSHYFFYIIFAFPTIS